jgi:hypothetical protein
MLQRRKAVTWFQFYDSISNHFCDHITKKNGSKIEMNINKSVFLCNECFEKCPKPHSLKKKN